MTPKFYGKAKGGVFVPYMVEQRRAYLIGLEGKELCEEIGMPKDNKTLQQLRYIHGIVFKYASEASGYTKIEVKGLLKNMFLKRYVTSKKTGKEISYVPSLEDVTKDEMREFIDDCIILCAKEWHCVIPSPEQMAV